MFFSHEIHCRFPKYFFLPLKTLPKNHSFFFEAKLTAAKISQVKKEIIIINYRDRATQVDKYNYHIYCCPYFNSNRLEKYTIYTVCY